MSARTCDGCGTNDRCHREGCEGIAGKTRRARWCCEACQQKARRAKESTTPEWDAKNQYQQAKDAGYAPIPPEELSAILARNREGCRCGRWAIRNGSGSCLKCGFEIVSERSRPKPSPRPQQLPPIPPSARART